jgi:hypothetical protein
MDSDLLNRGEKICCLLLSPKTLCNWYTELYVVFKKWCQKVHNILVWLYDFWLLTTLYRHNNILVNVYMAIWVILALNKKLANRKWPLIWVIWPKDAIQGADLNRPTEVVWKNWHVFIHDWCLDVIKLCIMNCKIMQCKNKGKCSLFWDTHYFVTFYCVCHSHLLGLFPLSQTQHHNNTTIPSSGEVTLTWKQISHRKTHSTQTTLNHCQKFMWFNYKTGMDTL